VENWVAAAATLATQIIGRRLALSILVGVGTLWLAQYASGRLPG
jgi:branched-subunit amino acid transport protein